MNTTLLDLANLLQVDMPAVVSYKELRQFILDHVSRQQRQVYDVVAEKPNCSSAVIELELNLNRQQASNVLGTLVDLKLVCREKNSGVYRYSVVV